MDQHAGVGNVVGVLDLDFEVVNRFRRAAGGDTVDSGDAVESLKPFTDYQAVGSDEDLPVDTPDRAIRRCADRF